VLVTNTGGQFQTAILLSLEPYQDPRRLTLDVGIRTTGDTNFKPAIFTVSGDIIKITHIEPYTYYDLRLIYRTETGFGSDPTYEAALYIDGYTGFPPDVESFFVQQAGGAVNFRWQEVIWFALKGYDILYGPQGDTIDTATFLTEALRGTEMTNASVPPGDWTFYIQAVDYAGNVSQIPFEFDMTVENLNTVIAHQEYTVEFPVGSSGTLFKYYRHWTGKLVPQSKNQAADYVRADPPDTSSWSLTQVPGGSFGATTYYLKLTYVNENSETTESAEISIAVDAGKLPKLVSSGAFGGSGIDGATRYNVYVSTSSGAETLQTVDPLSLAADWTLPLSGLVAGAAPPTENTTGWEVFDKFVPDPWGTCLYIADEINTGSTAQKRVWITFSAVPGPGEAVDYDVTTLLRAANTSGDELSQGQWVIGYTSFKYVQPELIAQHGATDAFAPYNPVAYIDAFQVTVDAELRTTPINSFTVGPTGSTLLFSDYSLAYHVTPNVQVTVASGTGTSGIAINVTTTGCEIHLYSGTVEVSGTANITITGV
jgi:hypothetical protein